jgi:hypothetical protein
MLIGEKRNCIWLSKTYLKFSWIFKPVYGLWGFYLGGGTVESYTGQSRTYPRLSASRSWLRTYYTAYLVPEYFEFHTGFPPESSSGYARPLVLEVGLYKDQLSYPWILKIKYQFPSSHYPEQLPQL